MTSRAPHDVLALPMPQNDAGAATIRDYLIAVLRLAWRDEAEYDGKRPFGNSGWQWEVYSVLADAGVIWSSRDEYDQLDVNIAQADAVIDAAILALGQPPAEVAR